MKKILGILLMAALLMTVLPAYADGGTIFGDAGSVCTFYVISQGNASISFYQTEGLCTELSYTHLVDGILGQEEEWGKYHLDVTTPAGFQYREDWNKTFNGSDYTLNLPQAGTYTIRVTPFTADEMTASWTLDHFVCWETLPQWRVSDTYRCSCVDRIWCDVTVKQVDASTGRLLAQRTERLYSGNNTVYAGSTPGGYTLADASQRQVYVYSSGAASENPVVFEYRKNAAPTSRPATQTVTPAPVSPSYGAAPYAWDTQYRRGMNSYDQSIEQSLSKLFDDNTVTGLTYVIWQSDRTDDTPEFTAYFNGASVSGFQIVNGKIASSDQFANYARAAHVTLRVHTSYGTYEEHLQVPDRYVRDHQYFAMSRTYDGVQQIDVYFEDFYPGGGETRYVMALTELGFY